MHSVATAAFCRTGIVKDSLRSNSDVWIIEREVGKPQLGLSKNSYLVQVAGRLLCASNGEANTVLSWLPAFGVGTRKKLLYYKLP